MARANSLDQFAGEWLLKQLTKLLVERALDAEMAEYLGRGKHQPVANPAGNTRNGKSKKTLKDGAKSRRSP